MPRTLRLLPSGLHAHSPNPGRIPLHAQQHRARRTAHEGTPAPQLALRASSRHAVGGERKGCQVQLPVRPRMGRCPNLREVIMIVTRTVQLLGTALLGLLVISGTVLVVLGKDPSVIFTRSAEHLSD